MPNSFLIGGREYHISSDFRAMLRLEEIFSSEKLTDEEKAERALKLFYGCIPEPLEEAVERLCYFWSCGRQEQEGRAKGEVQRSRRFIPSPMTQADLWGVSDAVRH